MIVLNSFLLVRCKMLDEEHGFMDSGFGFTIKEPLNILESIISKTVMVYYSTVDYTRGGKVHGRLSKSRN